MIRKYLKAIKSNPFLLILFFISILFCSCQKKTKVEFDNSFEFNQAKGDSLFVIFLGGFREDSVDFHLCKKKVFTKYLTTSPPFGVAGTEKISLELGCLSYCLEMDHIKYCVSSKEKYHYLLIGKENEPISIDFHFTNKQPSFY